MVRYSWVTVFMVLSLFPWVGSALNGLDTQPWVTFSLFCAYFLYFKNKSLSLPLLISAICIFLISLIVELNSQDFFGSSRILITVVNIYMAVQIGLTLSTQQVFKIIFSANIIYILGGVTQVLIDAEILGFIVDVRTNSVRGVTSFASEPTFFAITLLLFSIFYDVANYSRKLIFINFLLCVFLSKSTAGTLGFFSYFSVVYLWSASYRVRLISLFAAAILVVAILNLQLGRISTLAVKVSVAENILSEDESVKIRVLDFLTAPFMVVENYGLGVRSDEVSLKRNLVIDRYFSSEYGYISDSGKTSSYAGSLLVHFGAVFLILFFWSGILMRRVGRTDQFFGLWCVLILSVPPASILVPFIYTALLRPRYEN